MSSNNSDKLISFGLESGDTNPFLASDYKLYTEFENTFLPSSVVSFYSFTDYKLILGNTQICSNILKSTSKKQRMISRRFSGANQVLSGDNSLAYTYISPFNVVSGRRDYEHYRANFSEKLAKTLEEIGVKDVTIDNYSSTISSCGKIIASHTIAYENNKILVHGFLTISPFDLSKLKDDFYFGSKKIDGKTILLEDILENLPSVKDSLSYKFSKNVSENIYNEYLKNLIVDKFNELYVQKSNIITRPKIIIPTQDQIDYFLDSSWRLILQNILQEYTCKNTSNIYCYLSQVPDSLILSMLPK